LEIFKKLLLFFFIYQRTGCYRRLGSTDELVTREVNGVFIGKLVLALHERIHVYVDVRCGGGIVPEGQRSVPVKQDCDAVGVCQASGDIGGGSEAADLQPMRMLW